MKVDKQASKHFKKAWDLYLSHDYAQAKQELAKAIEIDSEWGQPHLLLGQIYFFDKKRDVEAAACEFRQVVELEPTWDEGYGWLSSALEELGQIDEAIEARRKAMRLAPKDSRHPIHLGTCLTQKKEYSEAIKMIRKGLMLKPHYGESDAHLYLAEALVADNQIDEACKEWQFVLTLEPMYPSYEHTHKEAKRMLKKYQRKASNNGRTS